MAEKKRFEKVVYGEEDECGRAWKIVDNATDKKYKPYMIVDCMNEIAEENEQLKQDNKILIRLLENQSIIIQKLHSKILEYQLKEPIVLTKEDLEIMGKAVSYYTHGRCPE